MAVGRDGHWPDPDQARTPGEFVAALRRLKEGSGLGYRSLEKASGGALPRSTLTAALARQTLPRAELVEALVRACGVPEDQVAAWLQARRRLAGGEQAAETADDPLPVRRFLDGLVPPAFRAGSWPVRVLAGVVLLVPGLVAAGAVGLVRDLAGSPATSSQDPGGLPDDAREVTSQPLGNPTSKPSATRTSPTPAVTSNGWVLIWWGEATVEDEQHLDFETMAVGGPEVSGWDLALSSRGVKVSAPKGVSVLAGPVPEEVQRCTQSAPDKWDSQWGPATALTPGRVICLATDQGRTVMVTVVRPPDSVTPVLGFRYAVWQRP